METIKNKLISILKRLFKNNYNLISYSSRISIKNVQLFFSHYINDNENIDDYVVDEQTAIDLDINDTFLKINKTSSKIGQQFLYYCLRIPHKDFKSIEGFIKKIDLLSNNHSLKEKTQKTLKKLNTHQDYFICDIIFTKNYPYPSWFKYTYFIQIVAVLSILFIWLKFSVWVFIAIFILNSVIHYRTKNRFIELYNGLGRIIVLCNIIKALIKLSIINTDIEILSAFKKCKKLSKKSKVFSLNNLNNNLVTQLLWVVVELYNIITLREVQRIFKILHSIEDYKKPLLILFNQVGLIDIAISVVEYRKSLPYYSIPQFVNISHTLKLTNCYHPLINECVPNNFEIHSNKNVFITGSNMSGKTSFIRTIGINVLLGRSIATCLSTDAIMSLFDIYSSIKINDNINEGYSYFFEELVQLKRITTKSEYEEKNNLVLIDEILKGTNVYDRKRITTSLLTYLSENRNNLIFASSHDIDLANELVDNFTFYNFQEILIENEIKFDYKIKKGVSSQTNAIRLLQILNFPKSILKNLFNE